MLIHLLSQVQTGIGGVLVFAPIFEALMKWWYLAWSLVELKAMRFDGWLKEQLPLMWCTTW